ncbi:hypothetical protein EVAR_60790_1 [Eumeta japonica]|uniref:Uncharacterized protein n=1 Tax=Eumeta variegata TaxID=151549 RepID=A0A4C2A0B8_EUMVA|nr:hypothetical protein EVAR_60790_1 [Eumeta japonica]
MLELRVACSSQSIRFLTYFQHSGKIINIGLVVPGDLFVSASESGKASNVNISPRLIDKIKSARECWRPTALSRSESNNFAKVIIVIELAVSEKNSSENVQKNIRTDSPMKKNTCVIPALPAPCPSVLRCGPQTPVVGCKTQTRARACP